MVRYLGEHYVGEVLVGLKQRVRGAHLNDDP
jgi:hypothetical protein